MELSPMVFEVLARYFRMLSEPTRLKILNTLNKGEMTVTQISIETSGNQPNISKHLAMLLNARMVGRRQSGNLVYYRITDPFINELCHMVCGKIAKGLDEELKLQGIVFAKLAETSS